MVTGRQHVFFWVLPILAGLVAVVTAGMSDGTASAFGWSTAAPMKEAKDDFGTVVVDGRIYAVGGQVGPDPTYVDDMQVYDPTSDSWDQLPSMPSAAGAVRAAAVDQTIYVVTFRSNVYAFDTDAHVWTNKANFPEELLVPDITAIDESIYVFGGFATTGAVGGTVSDVVYKYSVETDTWTSLSPMPTRRNHHSVVQLNGLVYVIGGSDEAGVLSSVDVYDPESAEWTSTTPMPVGMENFGAVAWDGQIHALFHHDHYVFDPETKEWAEFPPMITPRHGFGAAAIDGRLFVFGGCYEDPRFNTPHNEVFVLDSQAGGHQQPVSSVILLILASLALMTIVFALIEKGFFRGRTTSSAE